MRSGELAEKRLARLASQSTLMQPFRYLPGQQFLLDDT